MTEGSNPAKGSNDDWPVSQESVSGSQRTQLGTYLGVHFGSPTRTAVGTFLTDQTLVNYKCAYVGRNKFVCIHTCVNWYNHDQDKVTTIMSFGKMPIMISNNIQANKQKNQNST
jgi:hypothetical protein